jgi:hypothetical protein
MDITSNTSGKCTATFRTHCSYSSVHLILFHLHFRSDKYHLSTSRYTDTFTKITDKFYVLLTVHFDIFCNENQPDALFILNLFCQSTFTCFGHVYCPSSGGIHCICTATGKCCMFYAFHPNLASSQST